MEVSNKFVVIKSHIESAPIDSHFEIKTESLSLSLVSGSDDVLVKNLFISIDPYQLNRMKSQSSSQNTINFATPIIPNQVFLSHIILILFFILKWDELALYA